MRLIHENTTCILCEQLLQLLNRDHNGLAMPPVTRVTKPTQTMNIDDDAKPKTSVSHAHVVNSVGLQYLGRDSQQHVPVDKAVPEHSTIRFERLGRHPVANLLH
jgi:hypothetical protein